MFLQNDTSGMMGFFLLNPGRQLLRQRTCFDIHVYNLTHPRTSHNTSTHVNTHTHVCQHIWSLPEEENRREIYKHGIEVSCTHRAHTLHMGINIKSLAYFGTSHSRLTQLEIHRVGTCVNNYQSRSCCFDTHDSFDSCSRFLM